MATTDRRPTVTPPQPAGAEGEGLDAYPTYRDGATTPHRTSGGDKPTDTGLPRSRRTYAWPILIGLIVFALVIVVALVRGGMKVADTTEEALTPGGAATPPTASTSAPPATGAAPPDGAQSGAALDNSGTLDRSTPAAQSTGPGQVEATPGPADVPGGVATTPVPTAPAAPAQ